MTMSGAGQLEIGDATISCHDKRSGRDDGCRGLGLHGRDGPFDEGNDIDGKGNDGNDEEDLDDFVSFLVSELRTSTTSKLSSDRDRSSVKSTGSVDSTSRRRKKEERQDKPAKDEKMDEDSNNVDTAVNPQRDQHVSDSRRNNLQRKSSSSEGKQRSPSGDSPRKSTKKRNKGASSRVTRRGVHRLMELAAMSDEKTDAQLKEQLLQEDGALDTLMSLLVADHSDTDAGFLLGDGVYCDTSEGESESDAGRVFRAHRRSVEGGSRRRSEDSDGGRPRQRSSRESRSKGSQSDSYTRKNSKDEAESQRTLSTVTVSTVESDSMMSNGVNSDYGSEADNRRERKGSRSKGTSSRSHRTSRSNPNSSDMARVAEIVASSSKSSHRTSRSSSKAADSARIAEIVGSSSRPSTRSSRRDTKSEDLSKLAEIVGSSRRTSRSNTKSDDIARLNEIVGSSKSHRSSRTSAKSDDVARLNEILGSKGSSHRTSRTSPKSDDLARLAEIVGTPKSSQRSSRTTARSSDSAKIAEIVESSKQAERTSRSAVKSSDMDRIAEIVSSSKDGMNAEEEEDAIGDLVSFLVSEIRSVSSAGIMSDDCDSDMNNSDSEAAITRRRKDRSGSGSLAPTEEGDETEEMLNQVIELPNLGKSSSVKRSSLRMSTKSEASDITEDSKKKKNKKVERNGKGRRAVHFSLIEVREYSIELGDNPSCTCGPALSIGWSYNIVNCSSIDVYEANRTPRRSCYALRLPRTVRERRLNEMGYTKDDIEEAVRRITKDRFKRKSTITNMNFHRAEESLESARKKVSKLLKLRKKEGTTANRLMSDSMHGPPPSR